ERFHNEDANPSAPAECSAPSAPSVGSFDLRSHLERIFGVDLTVVPGFDVLRIQTIFSELGADLSSKFSTEDAFSSWLNLSPKDCTSAGTTHPWPPDRNQKSRHPNLSYGGSVTPQ